MAEVPYNPSGEMAATFTPNQAVARPDAFGGQIGEAMVQGGAQVTDVAQKLKTMADHTAVNDTIVNGYVPEANALLSNFKKLSGTDALQQQPEYEKQLKELNTKYIGGANNNQQAEWIGNYARDHSLRIMDGISNHADSEFTKHADLVHSQTMKMNADDAAQNYNSPELVDKNIKNIETSGVYYYGNKTGHDDESTKLAQSVAKEDASSAIKGVIQMALDNNDHNAATMYKNKYNDYLNLKDRVAIEKEIASVSVYDNGKQIVNNIYSGNKAIPQGTPQYDDIQKKAQVAEIAQKENFDPNILFAIHGAESSYGKGVKDTSRLKDDFQTDPKYRDANYTDDSLASSGHNAVKIWNQNTGDLATRLGRQPTPKEGYLSYNQGGLGASALLKASDTDTAVQALVKGAGLSQEDATKHVLQNGGTVTMSAKDFSNHIQDLFQGHYDKQKVTVADGANLPDAIRNQANAQTPAIQQFSNPHDLFKQITALQPSALAAIDAIPDDAVRESAFKQNKAKYEQAAFGEKVWKQQQADVVEKIDKDQRYTSMDMLPQSLKQDLKDAGQYAALEKKFSEKTKTDKDTSIGTGFLDVAQGIARGDKDSGVTDVASLNEVYGARKDIGGVGYNKLKSLVSKANTPEGKAEVTNQVDFLSAIKKNYYPTNSDADKQKFDAAVQGFFTAYTTNGADKSALLSLDANKNTFLKSLNLPSKAEVTSSKINEATSFLNKFPLMGM
jgi:hypothetical protein